MLAKQPKEYYKEKLDEHDVESLVAHENLTRHTSNSYFAYKVNNDDMTTFYEKMVKLFGLSTKEMKNKLVVSGSFMLIS